MATSGEGYFMKRQGMWMIKDSYFTVDALTQRDNIFTRMDARVKVALFIAALITAFSVPNVKFALGLFLLMMAALFFIKTPLKLLLGRVALPLMLASVVFLLLLFFQKGHPMFVVNLFGFELMGYREGFDLGTTILARTGASISLLLVLSVTTPVHELGYALEYLKFPKVIVEILLLTYRYLFVLWDEGMRIRQAQVLRLGYPEGRGILKWKNSFRSTSTLMAMVFIRAFDRAESTFNAMQVRSYDGNVSGRHFESWNRSQTSMLVSGVLVLVVLAAVSI
ncbi:MAG: cobalt ECF transporter T component CbiQ [Thermincola sp.]|nr:cobalt ECF transporter T component CbiQ [Thermincola sp.]